MGGKSRTELDPLQATATNNPRFRHQCVRITIQRLSRRTVCRVRVREISGRYKFGEIFALSKDGEGVHAPAQDRP